MAEWGENEVDWNGPTGAWKGGTTKVLMARLMGTGVPNWTAAALLAGALVFPGAAMAQVITGRVTDETGGPVRGAFVRLLDASDSILAGVLSDAGGRYALRAPGPGSYRMMAERIGLASVSTELFDVIQGEAQERSFTLASSPIALGAIVAVGRQRCDLRAAEGTALYALWEEARKAFEVVAHSRGGGLYRFRVRRFEREIDPESDRVLTERATARTGYLTGSPFVALDPARLLADGFVRLEADGSTVFNLPDVDVLLSNEFHQAHCFRLVPGRDAAGVGIAIEPARGREGLRGTLWLDRSSHEVRRLDYRLTDRTMRAREIPPAAGSIEFRGLSSGAWVVNRWNIRMPVMGERTIRVGPTRSERRLFVHRIREEGGEVLEIADAAGTVVARAGAATLLGRVFDREEDAPLAGARVQLTGTSRVADSDDQGWFEIRDAAPGRYTVSFRHPALDQYRIAPEPVPVDLAADATARLDLLVPPGFRLARLTERCLEEGHLLDPAENAGIIAGEVRGPATAEPLGGVHVRVSWTGHSGEARAVRQYRHALVLTTREDGSFLACGVPLLQPVRLQLDALDSRSTSREEVVRLDDPDTPYTHITLDATPAPH